MKIAVLTSLWDRPDIEEIMLDYYASLRDDLNFPLTLTAAYSEETQASTLARARSLGWHLFKTPSAPLGLKLNTATRALGASPIAQGITHVMTFGSDDLIHPTALWALCMAGEQHPAAGFVGAYFLCTQSWRAAHFVRPPTMTLIPIEDEDEDEDEDVPNPTTRQRILQHRDRFRRVPRPCGAGRILQRDVLDSLDWSPRADGMERGLDGSMDQRLRDIDVHWHVLDLKTLAAPVLDVKTARNLSSFDHMIRAGAVEVSPDEICDAFGAAWAQRLRALRAGRLSALL